MAVPPDPRLRELPSVERVLQQLEAEGHLHGIPRPLAARYVRRVVEDARRRLLDGSAPTGWSPASVFEESNRVVAWHARGRLTRTINATGIIIHTNLGRAPLSDAAQEAVRAALAGYTLLEVDPETGDRGCRQAHVEGLLEVVTGAEAGYVVNNNAAAVLLGLAALAAGRQVVVSRGELVEIGGAFRMPDVMAQSGARLVEVGTTNKTYLHDYERAISPETALLLKVHRSNFAMTGFVHEVEVRDLVALGVARGIPVMYDLGSGALVDLRTRNLPPEPTVQEAVAAGCALVTFSGDKLLGGPQAGVMVGRVDAVDRCRRHPLARAVRIDRLDLAALAATLRHYLSPEEAWQEVPVLRMLAADPHELTDRALWLARRLRKTLGDRATVTCLSADAQVGGGALPGVALPSAAVLVQPRDGAADAWASRLRQRRPPVMVRIHEGGLLLNLRTILPDELPDVVEAFR
ncbi:MAG: L-seryl-tRNA(Sec) selenium transferase [Armatimonadota bacterium]|nr:L-seryl-tRNA(Sec) selenium transferase [Armatimonadota bacterium]MDR7468771.1 L-seryl-tRNA(Sec) selenium transferase [Armatimonadota bacterium]MDR7473708.1 L-seryl-tRNA(Sec) selenium transferase [Armatimonadota bacterium]MDR7538598.1 L-seryl-tRNA(Sec) selenium transferase [Armatimonadota bacterium]